jgi:hypothetical protein
MSLRAAVRSPHIARDLLLLVAVAAISAAPYVTRLGFYSDDWAFLALLSNAPSQSFSELAATQYDNDPNLRRRPLQIVYQALLFKAFGLNPLGYHLINTAVLASVVVLIYAISRELTLPRLLALSIALVYMQLPNYSTDRFWFAAFSYALTVALFLAGTFAFLRSAKSVHQRVWVAWGTLLLSAAALGIEIVIPLIAAIPVAVWVRARHHPSRHCFGQSRLTAAPVLFGTPLLVSAGAVVYKALISDANGPPGLYYAVRLAVGSIMVNAGTFGIAYPHTFLWSVPQLSAEAAGLACLLTVLVFCALSRDDMPDGSPKFWQILILAGVAVFILGTVIFLITPRILFWSVGIANRVWIAAALGIAVTIVGCAGRVSMLFSARSRGVIFSVLITVVCVSGFVVTTALARYWVSAWPLQLEVLDDLRQTLPTLRSGTTVLLSGVCPYVGPAIVFESPWDFAGALRLAYGDPTLRGDVPRGPDAADTDGVRTQIYDQASLYRYGPDLLLFDHRRRTAVTLTSQRVARAHLAEGIECPPGAAGRGTAMLPLDRWFGEFEAKGFRPWRRP